MNSTDYTVMLTGLFLGYFFIKKLIEAGLKSTIENIHKKDFEKFKAEITKEIEQYKTALSNSVCFFSKQIEAMSSLNKLYVDIKLPDRENNDNWDYDCKKLAENFDRIENEILIYKAQFDAVLDIDILNILNECIKLCRDGKFERLDNIISENQFKMANTLYEKLVNVKEKLRVSINDQVKSPTLI